VSQNIFSALVFIVGGVAFAFHCPRAAVREFRSGTARGGGFGGVTKYNRSTNPTGFWIVIVGTFLAGAMGLLFVMYGASLLITTWPVASRP
jgi:hypothetical protein